MKSKQKTTPKSVEHTNAQWEAQGMGQSKLVATSPLVQDEAIQAILG